MQLFEALDKYNEDKNEKALYESIITSELNYNEMKEVLKDTLGKRYNENNLTKAFSQYILNSTKNAKSRPISEEDFD